MSSRVAAFRRLLLTPSFMSRWMILENTVCGKITFITISDQCQGQLVISGRSELYLYVWLPSGAVRIQVETDLQWIANSIPLLLQFFFSKMLPEIRCSSE